MGFPEIWVNWLSQEGFYHGNGLPNEDLALPLLAKQRFQELVAMLAETGFGPDGPSPETDFATIEPLGHRAGRMLGRAIDEHLIARHAQHFQEASCHCPTCDRGLSPSADRTAD